MSRGYRQNHWSEFRGESQVQPNCHQNPVAYVTTPAGQSAAVGVGNPLGKSQPLYERLKRELRTAHAHGLRLHGYGLLWTLAMDDKQKRSEIR